MEPKLLDDWKLLHCAEHSNLASEKNLFTARPLSFNGAPSLWTFVSSSITIKRKNSGS